MARPRTPRPVTRGLRPIAIRCAILPPYRLGPSHLLLDVLDHRPISAPHHLVSALRHHLFNSLDPGFTSSGDLHHTFLPADELEEVVGERRIVLEQLG